MNQAKLSKHTLLKYLENLPSHFLLIDKTEVLIETETSGLLAESPLLWSNNASHIAVYTNLFDELWNSSVESAALNSVPEDERIVTFVKQLTPKNHYVLLYEKSDAKLAVALTFVTFALENKESVVYICSELSVEEIRAYMIQHGLDVKLHEKTGALKIIDYTQHFIIDGKFDVQNSLDLLAQYSDEALSKKLKGICIFAETTCFFKHNMLKELSEYEKKLHNGLNLPITSIYAYPANQLMNPDHPINFYQELAKSHPLVLFSLVGKKFGRIAIS